MLSALYPRASSVLFEVLLALSHVASFNVLFQLYSSLEALVLAALGPATQSCENRRVPRQAISGQVPSAPGRPQSILEALDIAALGLCAPVLSA